MKKTKLIAIVVGILVLSFSILYHPIPSSEGFVEAASDQASGKDIYQKNCASCHGSDGQAKTFRGKLTHAQNLASADWQAGNTDEDIAEAIRTGPKKMPSFAKKLSAADVTAVTRYVRTLKR
jgi:cbb3-type cytochrome c oxidase subunit III